MDRIVEPGHSFLRANAEVVVLVYDVRTCARIAVEQARYLGDGEMLNLDVWGRRPAVVKIAENLARLLSPLL